MLNHNVIYYVKKDDGVCGKLSYWVYAHYPATMPDTPCMVFDFQENAEMVCRALNAENNYVPYSLYIDKTVSRKSSRSFTKR